MNVNSRQSMSSSLKLLKTLVMRVLSGLKHSRYALVYITYRIKRQHYACGIAFTDLYRFSEFPQRFPAIHFVVYYHSITFMHKEENVLTFFGIKLLTPSRGNLNDILGNTK